ADGILPTFAVLEAQRGKQLTQRSEFLGAADFADCGDAFDHVPVSSLLTHRAPQSSHFHEYLGIGTGSATNCRATRAAPRSRVSKQTSRDPHLGHLGC